MLLQEEQTLPLDMAELQKVLESKTQKDIEKPEIVQDIMMNVSYEQSTLKGKFFLNYVGNLKLSITLSDDATTAEDRMSLLQNYMESSNQCEVHTLNDIVAVMLLEEKGAGLENDDLWIKKPNRDKFRSDNKELIAKWTQFLDSTVYNLPFCIEQYSATIGKKLIEDGTLELVSDANWIGKNVVYLYTVENYIENYISYPTNTIPKFFESQWLEPIFTGYSLMSVMVEGNGSLFPFMLAMFDQWYKEDTTEAKGA